MLIVTKKRYKKQHVIGGSGIFDTIINFAKRLITSGAAKSAASALASSAAKQAGKHIVDRMLQAAPAAPAVPVTEPSLRSEAPTLTQKSKEDLASLIHRPATNLNNLMMSGAAIKIQDLARGSGVKKIIN